MENELKDGGKIVKDKEGHVSYIRKILNHMKSGKKCEVVAKQLTSS